MGTSTNCRPIGFKHVFTFFFQIPSLRFLPDAQILTPRPYDRFLRFSHTFLMQMAQLFFTLFPVVVGVLCTGAVGLCGLGKIRPKNLAQFF